MRARQAQLAMYKIELHDQEFTVEEFLQWLLGLDDEDPITIEKVLIEEMRRALSLIGTHYGQYVELTPHTLVAIGFQQGATFAAAALGREPYPD